MSQAATPVGPVLEASEWGLAVASAIEQANPGTQVVDRGAYLRVLAPPPCRITRAAIERALGGEFRLPMDLERLMPSFRGFLRIDDDHVEWRNAP